MALQWRRWSRAVTWLNRCGAGAWVVLAEPVLMPGTDKVAFDAGTMLDEASVQKRDLRSCR